VSVEAIVPFRANGCRHRTAAWGFVSARYCEHHPGWRLTRSLGPEPWVKAASVMPAIERSDAEIVVVADADVWCAGLTRAVEAVKGGAPWAIPHTIVHRLTESSTLSYMAGADYRQLATAEKPRKGVEGGGFVVARRETLLEAPLDPRFVGWGQEDLAWALSLYCLAGPPWRGSDPLIHLFHPPQARLDRKWGSLEGKALHRRYTKARLDPDAMRKIIEEGRLHARNADQPPLQADPAL
jgi:hypothetical protein